MDRDEYLYRKTGQALVVLLVLWIIAMFFAATLPARAWKSPSTSVVFFDGIFPCLFVTAVVLGVIRMVSYFRWTGGSDIETTRGGK